MLTSQTFTQPHAERHTFVTDHRRVMFPPTDHGLPTSPDLEITIEDGSENSEEMLEDENNEHEINTDDLFGIGSSDFEDGPEHVLGIDCNDLGNNSDQIFEFGSNDEENYYKVGADCDTLTIDEHNNISQETAYPAPVVGMEFDSYDDAYSYYNCYAKELGFAIRVKSSWTKRNSKEKRGAVLCCNCEGFKMIKEASSRRKETRTGCLAMIRLRLVESGRWKVDEVKLDHNHLFDPERAQNSKSHKKIDTGAKRKESPVDVEVRTIKLYRTPVVDTVGYGSPNEREIDHSKRLKLKKGDAEVISKFFARMQLTNPNFFYVMDFNDEGHLRNVFWIDSRSRAAYGYFGDVIALDTRCLSDKYEIPLLAFFGVNHHGKSILLGCGLLVDEFPETYIWLLRSWLTCMLGRPPQTIISDRCKALQAAISEVFPRAHHRFCLSGIMQSILENFKELQLYKVFEAVLSRTVQSCVKVDEFELAWEDMLQHFGIKDNVWLQSLYEDRERWVPVYSKDTFFAGMISSQPTPFFDGVIQKETTLKEFFNAYESVSHQRYQKEVEDDCLSKESTPVLKTSYPYELQLFEAYTKEIFSGFQEELERLVLCLSITQIHANGSIITYMIKERGDTTTSADTRNYEVMYDKAGVEVRCICSCFNFKGYLCRHALCALNFNCVEEIPPQYILPRWRKDFKRLYVPDVGSNCIDISNPVQWYDHLYRRAVQVVEEGMVSHDHYKVAWHSFKESLNKVRLVADKDV